MGNQQSEGDTTIVQEGSLKKGQGIESNVNYIQLEERKDSITPIDQKSIQKEKKQMFQWLQKLNCVQGYKNRTLPDWKGYTKYQLTENLRYSQHGWANDILRLVQNFEGYQDHQRQSIQEIARAAEQSFFDSSDFLARRKDSWRGSQLSSKSSQSSYSSYASEIHKQAMIQREKKLQDIIESTELLRESVQEQRNSFFSSLSQQKNKNSNSENNFNSSISSDKKSYVFCDIMQEEMSEEVQQKEEEIYDNMFKNLNRYKEITRIFQQHMANVQKNPIAFMLIKYVEYFCNTYDQVKLSQPNTYLKIITDEINDFIQFLVDILRTYYKLDFLISNKSIESSQSLQKQEQNDMFLSTENLHNFLCSLLFSFDGLYRKVSKLFIDSDEKLQQQLKIQIDQKQDILMTQLGIKKEFQLINISHPFTKAIEHFKRVQITKSPLQKLKMILQTYEIIEQTIRDYYEQNQIPLLYSCDADNFLGIMQFLIIKSKAYTIYSDIKLIDHFVKNHSSKSISSYQLITLQASIFHISTHL